MQARAPGALRARSDQLALPAFAIERRAGHGGLWCLRHRRRWWWRHDDSIGRVHVLCSLQLSPWRVGAVGGSCCAGAQGWCCIRCSWCVDAVHLITQAAGPSAPRQVQRPCDSRRAGTVSSSACGASLYFKRPTVPAKVHTASYHFLGNAKIRSFGCSLLFSGVASVTHHGLQEALSGL